MRTKDLILFLMLLLSVIVLAEIDCTVVPGIRNVARKAIIASLSVLELRLINTLYAEIFNRAETDYFSINILETRRATFFGVILSR